MNREDQSRRVLEICDEALALEDGARASYLESVCDGDSALRSSVNSVLLAVDGAGPFLSLPGDASADAGAVIGTRVGSYEIIEQLGEGGMGTVYLAERREADYTQIVAIKMVRGHLLAPELIERFNSERNILAGLHHPYIAQLIDAGQTQQGIPYLVMEYVEGLPIDEYCDQHKLDIGARLRLIMKVAMAVQAAHQNLVVHRDLKPSNVLITQDGIPKLLDFGIAKLIQSGESAHSGHTTIFGHQAMTPDYASPEQILEGRVTTASDVYTLGVLAYNLLTGKRPYSLDTSNHSALLRSIENQTLVRPSERVMTTRASPDAADFASRRATTPVRLARRLAGDLDMILLKALHRDPARRYESMSAFRLDIDRYLRGLPVDARADSLGYRFGKLISRHRLGAAAVSIAILAVLAGLGVSLWQAQIARAHLSRAEAVSRYLGDILLSPSLNWDASIQTGADATISEVLDAAETQLNDDLLDQPEVRLELYNKIGEARGRMGDYDAAIRIQTTALQLATTELPAGSGAHLDAYYFLAMALHSAERHADAREMFEKAKTLGETRPGPPSVRLLYVLHDYADLVNGAGEPERALALQIAVIEGIDEVFGDELLPQSTNAYNNLGVYHFALGNIEDAESSFLVGIEAHELYPEQTELAGAMMRFNLAAIRLLEQRHDEAIELLRRARALLLGAGAQDYEEYAEVVLWLALALLESGETQGVQSLIDEAAVIGKGYEEHPDYWIMPYTQATHALKTERPGQAIDLAREALRLRDDGYPHYQDQHFVWLTLARALAAVGQTAEARDAYETSLRAVRDWLGDDHAQTRRVAAEMQAQGAEL